MYYVCLCMRLVYILPAQTCIPVMRLVYILCAQTCIHVMRLAYILPAQTCIPVRPGDRQRKAHQRWHTCFLKCIKEDYLSKCRHTCVYVRWGKVLQHMRGNAEAMRV